MFQRDSTDSSLRFEGGPMIYQMLGSTTLKVSRLAFGASTLGNVFGDVDASSAQQTVDAAIDQGINFFDVSPYYGETLAESRLGEALVGKRDKILLATKCGRYGVDTFDFSAARILESMEESLRRLKTDYVDLLQVHDVEFGSIDQIVEETIPAMRRLQEQGKVRYLGITGYQLEMLQRIHERAPVDTILSYCRYDLLNQDLNAHLAGYAKQHRVGLLSASPLCMGLLTDDGPPAWHPAAEEARAAAARAADLCRRNGVSLAEVALEFSLNNPLVATTLVGMRTPEELQMNLMALEHPRHGALIPQVLEAIGTGFLSTWDSGLPENFDRNPIS